MLVVDDEREITQVLADFLTSRGHDVSEAQSGTQALALAHQRHFDIIFLDILMPGLDGNETLRQLKMESPRTIIIMISGTSDEDTALKSLELGAFDFIRKPFEFSRIDTVVALGLAALS